MTVAGWIFMVSSALFVWGLCGWCFYKVLTIPPEEIPEQAKDFRSA